MNVGFPLGDAIPGARGHLLDTLAQLERPVTVRALARYGGVSPQRALDIVHDLTIAGLLTTEGAGQALMVSLNQHHLLADPLLELARTRKRLVTRLTSQLGEWKDLAGAWLFGSAARGDGDRGSDIDLLLVAQETVESDGWGDHVSSLIHDVRLWTGNQPQIVEHTRATFMQLALDGNPLVASIRAEGIPLTAPSRVLEREAR